VFSTAAGWLYGLWVDGAGLGVVALWLVGILAVIWVVVWLMGKLKRAPKPATTD